MSFPIRSRSSKSPIATPYDRPSGALKVSSDRSTDIPIIDGKDWNWACRELGMKGPVTKNDDDYKRVRSLFRAANGLSPVQESPNESTSLKIKTPSMTLWVDCCKKLNIPFTRKGTPAYDQVMELFRSRVSELPEEELADPKQKLWQECCKKLGFVRPKKGTSEHSIVLDLYIAESQKAESMENAQKDDDAFSLSNLK